MNEDYRHSSGTCLEQEPAAQRRVTYQSQYQGDAEMLDQQQTLSFKTQLRQRATQLRDELQRTREKSIEEMPAQVAERARDSEDDSFATLIADTNLTEMERDADELRMIDSALQRISAGTYGSCVDCGQPIPVARLKAEPTAERCVQCQELFEKTHASARTPSL